MDKTVIIYTDGSSSGNPGPGGWGAVVRSGEQVFELGGSADQTTNNRMEMTAAIEALHKTLPADQINLYTDSSYLINGITKWVHGWQKNNWQTKQEQEVLNKDLWMKLIDLNQPRNVSWVKVRGHADVALNNRVDEIAVSFTKTISEKGPQPVLYEGPAADYQFEVVPPTAVELASVSKKSKSGPAYSYLSMVDGVIEKHRTWDECKSRAVGVSGAKYRKSLDAADELAIIQEWQN